MNTANPALNPKAFRQAGAVAGQGVMTIDGTVQKTAILLAILLAGAAWVWSQVFTGDVYGQTDFGANAASAAPWMMAGGIMGFIFALVTIFKQNLAPYTAAPYALCEGLFLGGISASFEMRYPGIAMQATALTFGVLFAMLFLYKAKVIKVTEKFAMGLMCATGAIALVYLVSMVMSFFGTTIPYIHEGGPIGIGFSLVVCGIAAFSLIMDFHMITENARYGAPKYMEWYGAFGLILTLVWLYMEILRLLSKLNSRD